MQNRNRHEIPDGKSFEEVYFDEIHEIEERLTPDAIDCRMKWGGRAVIVSDTTAVLLLGAMRELQRQGGIKAKDADGARVLCQAFDECALIERDVAASLESAI